MIKSKKWITLPMEKLAKAPWNYKMDDPVLLEKLMENIKRNGQIENILVRELDTGFFEVVNGNHRIDALKKLEMKEVVCFNLGPITERQASRIAIETNETRFQTNNASLAGLIKEIADEVDLGDLSTTLPFTESEMGEMIQSLDFDWNSFGDPDSGGGDPPAEGDNIGGDFMTCPECGHTFPKEGK